MKINQAKLIFDEKIIEVTPEIIAEFFCDMGSDEQAAFFNHISTIATTWLPMQLQGITDEHGLNLGGRRVMQEIGEYSHWGLVPKAWKIAK